jgi:hypothetical protein
MHGSPAMVVAVIALVVALGGTAIAAGNALTGKQKKQTGKIATKVFNSRIRGAGVAHATTADMATEAGKATTADSATKAATADKADFATKAGEAEKLDGVAADVYQHKLSEQCPAPESISTIDQQGDVTCNTTVVRPLHRVLNPSEQFAFSLGNGLQLLAICHDGGNTTLRFQNLGPAAHLSWFYGEGPNSAAAAQVLGVGDESIFAYTGGVIEGQFIWSVGEGVDTINVSVVDHTISCEIAGTAISAIG